MLIKEVNNVAFEPMNEIHKNELQYINNFYNALEKNEDVKKHYFALLEDIKKHFEFEEKLMEKYGFFAIVPHKMEHERILKELTSLEKELTYPDTVKKYLKNVFVPWLLNHIATIDTVTAGFFKTINAQTDITT